MHTNFLRGTMKMRTPFLLIAAAILMTGGAARAQDATPAAPASTESAPAQTAAPAPATDNASNAANNTASNTARTVPVTTNVVMAQRAYEMGMVHREDLLFVDEGLDFFRESVQADPQFALGHAAVGYFTSDPKEEKRESDLAVKYMSNASPDEQLLITWMNGTKNGELVAAISAMNDLMAKYPHDERLGNLDAEWLCSNQFAY